jgi:hypothetical protein
MTYTNDIGGSLTLEWYPIPGRAWVVQGLGGRGVRSFHTLKSARAWLKRRGYQMLMPVLTL